MKTNKPITMKTKHALCGLLSRLLLLAAGTAQTHAGLITYTTAEWKPSFAVRTSGVSRLNICRRRLPLPAAGMQTNTSSFSDRSPAASH